MVVQHILGLYLLLLFCCSSCSSQVPLRVKRNFTFCFNPATNYTNSKIQIKGYYVSVEPFERPHYDIKTGKKVSSALDTTYTNMIFFSNGKLNFTKKTPQKLFSNGINPSPIYLSQKGAYNSPFHQTIRRWGIQKVQFMGYFHDAPIYKGSFFNDGSAVTLPPNGIYMGEGTYIDALVIDNARANDNEMTLRHEYGHWIHWEQDGSFYYYNVVAPASSSWNLRNRGTNINYYEYWTEKKANTLAYYYFGKPSWWDPYYLLDLNNKEWCIGCW